MRRTFASPVMMMMMMMMMLLLRSLTIVAIAVSLAATVSGCGSGAPGGGSPQDAVALGRDDFRTAVSRSVRRHFSVYWLGETVNTGTTVLYGPDFNTNDGANTPDQLEMAYSPPGPGIGLHILLMSRTAWADAAPHIRGTEPGSSESSVMAGEYPATLYRLPLDGRPNLLRVAIPLGDTVVLADTAVDGSSAGATPPTNPLTIEATLLSVLGELRPYPQ